MASTPRKSVFGWFQPSSTKISLPREFSQKRIVKTQLLVKFVAVSVVIWGSPREFVGLRLSKELDLGEGAIGAQKVSVLLMHLEKEGFSKQLHEKFIYYYHVRDLTLPRPDFEAVYRLVFEHRRDPVWTALEYPADASVYKHWNSSRHYAKLILAIVAQAGHADVLPLEAKGSSDGQHPAAAAAPRETPTVGGREIAGAVEGNLTPWIKYVSLNSNIWTLYHALLYLQDEYEVDRARK
ncbi:hypothetical protein PFICI_07921 [Pestalotiopsis fici W106-1]|uniref:Uncharacterized protein n=1 Tax=Pestalotiopsis fici (strain W106-1 / CGMCC3.15140) TaxID=1229662 RepID=W3X4S2_PESFW|nr:uncharacterized protein PFICI_07921 [Pestalotiopsis fici W106-1]ETS80392.1 hypothetical protein PFICI_07921 [Pestalotiopsis fici W106-1]